MPLLKLGYISLMKLLIPILIIWFSIAFVQADRVAGMVVGITDGDTLTLLVETNQVKIRLSEIDTPEKGQPWGWLEPGIPKGCYHCESPEQTKRKFDPNSEPMW